MGLSESFIVGVIAIVFLIMGYQTALFIHQAAVMKITANRDNPDTVYVRIPMSRDSTAGVSDSKASGAEAETVRRYAGHSPRAREVRDNVPRKTVETFRFDPNTVSG